MIDLAAPGDWESHAEIDSHSSGFLHHVRIWLTRPARRELVVVSVRHLFPAVDQAIAHLDALLHDARREFDSWTTTGMLVLDASTANRRVITERHDLVATRFPRSGS